jgi:hypothetical protein
MADRRVLVWFSCGAASAVAAKMAVRKYPAVEVLYCDTLKYEHSDNRRFLLDVQDWLGQEIKILRSEDYEDIFDVFRRTRWLIGPQGARCTTELKKKVRMAYQRADDLHVFGYTSEEGGRIEDFTRNNPELDLDWILYENGISKRECLWTIKQAGIELPAMYRLGYRNNNCIGCVKGGAGYWNKIRNDFPEAFDRMSKLERELDAAICKRYEGKDRIRVFLDELDPNAGDYPNEPDISCGVQCSFQFAPTP